MEKEAEVSETPEPVSPEVVEEQDPKRPHDIQLAWKMKQQHEALRNLQGLPKDLTVGEELLLDAKIKRALDKPKAYRPAPGYTFNPLKAYPPNLPCFCGSGIKFKRCHDTILNECVLAEKVPEMTRFRDEMAQEVSFLKEQGVTFRNEPAAIAWAEKNDPTRTEQSKERPVGEGT